MLVQNVLQKLKMFPKQRLRCLGLLGTLISKNVFVFYLTFLSTLPNMVNPLTPRAPADCLQYHTGTSGYFQSFNFPNGQLLSSQAYRVCFRQELGGWWRLAVTIFQITAPSATGPARPLLDLTHLNFSPVSLRLSD